MAIHAASDFAVRRRPRAGSGQAIDFLEDLVPQEGLEPPTLSLRIIKSVRWTGLDSASICWITPYDYSINSEGHLGRCWIALANIGRTSPTNPLLIRRSDNDINPARPSGLRCLVSFVSQFSGGPTNPVNPANPGTPPHQRVSKPVPGKPPRSRADLALF